MIKLNQHILEERETMKSILTEKPLLKTKRQARNIQRILTSARFNSHTRLPTTLYENCHRENCGAPARSNKFSNNMMFTVKASNDFVSSKSYDKCNDFDFDIVIFLFLDGDVPLGPSYGVYISQFIRYARVCSHVEDFNARNRCLTAKILKQGDRYYKLRKAFFKVLSPTL